MSDKDEIRHDSRSAANRAKKAEQEARQTDKPHTAHQRKISSQPTRKNLGKKDAR